MNKQNLGYPDQKKCVGCVYMNSIERREYEGGCLFCLMTGKCRLQKIEECTYWTPSKNHQTQEKNGAYYSSFRPTDKKNRGSSCVPQDVAMTLYDMGLSDSEISRRINISQPTIRRWRINNNLPINSRALFA